MRRALVDRNDVFDQAWRSLNTPGSVLLEGPAGIGKTALQRALVAEATQAGWHVLACAPTESETDLPFAALADLLRPLADLVLGLPRPQRIAAEMVLLTHDSDETVDERVVGAATRSLLEATLAAGRPVLVAVDDAPWLDRPSERALRFALRRVGPGLATLVSSRTDHAPALRAAPLGLDTCPGPLTRLPLAPLGVGALHHLLRERTGATLSRPLLARIARESGGNPLVAIEVTRAVQRLPRPPEPAQDLPVASSMHQLLGEVLARLPARCRDAVRLAALLGVPLLRDLAAAGFPPAAFDAAEEAGLLAVGPLRVEFTHPVHAAAVRAGIPPGVRRGLHRRLAEVVTDPDERVRHLALCTTTADPVVADALAAAAARQHVRGAPEAAANLYESAARLTPTDDEAGRGRRLLAAARCRFGCGDHPGARAAADAVATGFSGEVRAEALLLRAVVAWSADESGGTAVEAAERALAATRPDSPLAGRIHAHLALFVDLPDPARTHAEAAIALLTGPDGDRTLLAAALLYLFFHEVRAGEPPRTELLDRALKTEGPEPSWLAGTIPAIWWKAIDDPAQARARLRTMLDLATARGDEPSQYELLKHLGETELLAGRWAAAERHISAARELGELLGTEATAETWLTGLLDALRGRLDVAQQVAEAGVRLGEQLDDDWCLRIHLQLGAFVALCAGRMTEAAAGYGRLATTVDRLGLAEPLAQRFEADWIEACVGAGDLVTARTALDRLAQRHRRLPRPWTLLGLARSRALLDSAGGVDPSAALADLAAARASVPPDILPLDRARCLLVAGVVHRRSRRKRPAREALRDAAAEFDAIGASAFARRARAEGARLGGRPPAPSDLTATEERVARLAAQGRTSRTIADELFVSPKTVETNLSRVYRKLGISRRAELGAALARVGGPDERGRRTEPAASKAGAPSGALGGGKG
ncbi:LuxR family transcriptional regulator [Micromonospora sp. WMMD1082]|uniref:helix-turn-helix transcriptional regulator n=1 Tax=Micromonospora sp. WMMD1082 TaxID=3016104 RepID=UPI00241653D2|nr:LuxR family transcriptional regulator [Micromonospora sp. WMMD1082]MDG4798795.1 AAA family ATPase [Micromonospora sp. WMMD1082]